MPNNVIKGLADKSGESVEKVEELWEKAKSIAKEEYDVPDDSEKFYKIVTGIVKKMLKITEESDASITTTSMGGANAQYAKYMGMVKRNDVKPKKKKKVNESFRTWLH